MVGNRVSLNAVVQMYEKDQVINLILHNQTTEFLILCGHAHWFSLLPFWKKFFLEKVREAVHFFLVSLQDFLFDLRCEDFFW